MTLSTSNKLGLVVIGRNEGERLATCLASVSSIPNRVYVDSGSTDDSVALARRQGVTVVELRPPPNFTAARARNAGIERLLADHPELEFVQVIDGDCEMQPGWLEAALAALATDPKLAGVLGRRRERYPDRSVYNALCDDEWNIPIGDAPGCGGDAILRLAALRQVNFYNPSMIAAEDSEMSMRLREAGWRLARIDHEMTLHDAAILHFGQWWRRTQRSGHGFGEIAFLHPDSTNPDYRRIVRSIVFWGGIMPALLVGAVILAVTVDYRFWALAGLFFVGWPLRMVQLARRQRNRGLSAKVARASGICLMFGKIPQLQGLLGYYRDRSAGRKSSLIEYKGISTG